VATKKRAPAKAAEILLPTILRPPTGMTIYYANHAGLTITPWDFNFRFGRILDISSAGVTVEEGLMVSMSPPHVKAFFAMLKAQIEKYEEKYGQISEPPTAAVQVQEIGVS